QRNRSDIKGSQKSPRRFMPWSFQSIGRAEAWCASCDRARQAFAAILLSSAFCHGNTKIEANPFRYALHIRFNRFCRKIPVQRARHAEPGLLVTTQVR